MTVTPEAHTDVVNWKRTRAIFDSVVDLAPAERSARLALICGDDLALRQEVESLLIHDRAPRDLVGQVVAEAARAVSDAHAPLRSGDTLLHYGLTWKLGEGGMGVVWKATDFTLGRDVAIKVLPADFACDPVRLARFEREAKLLAALNHPNIAGIYSLHEDAGVRFLAMEFVEGDDLSVRVARGPLPLAEVLQVTRQIAEALEDAHEKGIVHRDLKPANVKVKADGTVKVLDFGLAKALADEVGSQGSGDRLDMAQANTRAGVILGTAAYMPPEQARGLAVDKRADIWAFGVMLFEMLAGTRPFVGPTLTDVLAAVVTAEPDWTLVPATTPAALVQLTRRCLQKDARQRLRDIGDARIELARLAREAPPGLSLAVPLRRRRVAIWVGVAAAVVAAAVGIGSWIGRGSGPGITGGAGRSIAVLPLVDLSADPNQEYFADGLTEDLLSRLARNPQLRVAGRTSAFQFKNAPQDPRTIGRALGVSALLEGSVRRSGNRVRITAQLVNAEDGFQLWSESYDREIDDIFAVQDEIARAVAGALHIALLGDQPMAAARGGTGPAYNAYLQGKYFRQLNTKDSLDKAAGYFRQAVMVDPAFAPAWAGLSLTHSAIGAESYAPLDAVFGEARRAAERAVALDPRLAEGHTALSVVRRVYDWDWAGADAAAQRALQLEPNNAEIVLSAARVASTLGRLDEALVLARRAATLDPLNVAVYFRLARYESYAGQFDLARTSFARTLELNPEYPAAHTGLGLALLGQGHAEEALAELAREAQPLWQAFGYAYAYHRLDRRAEADAALAHFIDRFKDTAAAQIAQLYALRGQRDETLEWLAQAYRLRDPGLSQQKVLPEFLSFDGEPRYRAFLDKMRLPP